MQTCCTYITPSHVLLHRHVMEWPLPPLLSACLTQKTQQFCTPYQCFHLLVSQLLPLKIFCSLLCLNILFQNKQSSNMISEVPTAVLLWFMSYCDTRSCHWVSSAQCMKSCTAFTFRVKQSSTAALTWPWRWRHYKLLKSQKLLTLQHSVTSRKTWILKLHPSDLNFLGN
jgi:hypothetical protein